VLSRLTSFSAACLIGLSAFAASDAKAQSARVRTACTADAKRLCPQYKAGGSELRYCMEARGRSLSQGCVFALEAEGIIPRGTYSRGRSRS
jgi:hypothetical protein